jgi:hypothetical protein
MSDLKQLGVLLLGFIPWLLFLLLSGHSLTSLEHAIIVSLIASVALGFGDLRRGYILTWGTLLFFCFCAVFVNLSGVLWVAAYMDLLSNAVLAGIMWLTILVGKPFALQYARRDVPNELWNDPKFIQGGRFITLVWAGLMSVATGLSILRRSSIVDLPGWVYFDASLFIILTGLTVTTLFKRKKRLQREKEEARNQTAT